MRSIWLASLLLLFLPALASAQPAIVSVNPNTAVRGASVDVQITGSGTLFMQESEVTSVVWLSNGVQQINGSNVSVTSSILLTAHFDIPSNAALGLWDVNVEQVGGSVVTLANGFSITSACAISDLAAGTQTACAPATNTYTQVIVVTFANPPTTGTLLVNGQSFAIGTSPQSVTLTGLVANGAAVNVTANFSAQTGCSRTENALFTAPVSCTPVCAISDLAAGTQTACAPATNTYTQVIVVTFANPPTTGTLLVNGQSFAIGTSPQSVTLTGLVANGAAVNVTANFSAQTGCSRTENALFTAPASCGQGGGVDCSRAEPSSAVLRSPNHKFHNVSIRGVADRDGDGDDVAITITSVTSDEPVDGRGDDKTCPDALIRSDGTVRLRAERSGSGNGRVYTIHFTATDGSGRSCNGEVFVCVPHDQDDDDGNCIRDEVQYDATRCNAAKTSLSERPPHPVVARLADDQISILFTTVEAGPVDLRIYDLRGRLVRRLATGDFPAGEQELRWDGRDASGHEAASGVYLVRVVMDGEPHTCKTVWMR